MDEKIMKKIEFAQKQKLIPPEFIDYLNLRKTDYSRLTKEKLNEKVSAGGWNTAENILDEWEKTTGYWFLKNILSYPMLIISIRRQESLK